MAAEPQAGVITVQYERLLHVRRVRNTPVAIPCPMAAEPPRGRHHSTLRTSTARTTTTKVAVSSIYWVPPNRKGVEQNILKACTQCSGLSCQAPSCCLYGYHVPRAQTTLPWSLPTIPHLRYLLSKIIRRTPRKQRP